MSSSEERIDAIMSVFSRHNNTSLTLRLFFLFSGYSSNATCLPPFTPKHNSVSQNHYPRFHRFKYPHSSPAPPIAYHRALPPPFTPPFTSSASIPPTILTSSSSSDPFNPPHSIIIPSQ